MGTIGGRLQGVAPVQLSLLLDGEQRELGFGEVARFGGGVELLVAVTEEKDCAEDEDSSGTVRDHVGGEAHVVYRAILVTAGGSKAHG